MPLLGLVVPEPCLGGLEDCTLTGCVEELLTVAGAVLERGGAGRSRVCVFPWGLARLFV